MSRLPLLLSERFISLPPAHAAAVYFFITLRCCFHFRCRDAAMMPLRYFDAADLMRGDTDAADATPASMMPLRRHTARDDDFASRRC